MNLALPSLLSIIKSCPLSVHQLNEQGQVGSIPCPSNINDGSRAVPYGVRMRN
jgi:hypothetical protein